MLVVTPLRNPAAGDLAGDAGGATNIETSDDFSVEFDFDFSEIFAGFDDVESPPCLRIDVEQKEEGEETIVNDKCENVLVKEEILVEKVKESGRKSSIGEKKRSNGKRKVDWTAELHRRFVQVVEQLGEEHAVPSRILELMGIDCLTRHNVASHLQKYRSHQRHRMARDAEKMSSKQRRQVYATCLPHHVHYHEHTQQFRPLHVWGHPTMNQSLIHMWPKHLIPVGPTSSLPWLAPPHPIQPIQISPRGSPWSPHFAVGTMTQGAPFFLRPPPTLSFPAQPMLRPDGMILATPPPTPLSCKQTGWLHQLDALPSKESIDAALGDVLGQPWLPLPLGLKPPSLESVILELHKQGISNVPPNS